VYDEEGNHRSSFRSLRDLDVSESSLAQQLSEEDLEAIARAAEAVRASDCQEEDEKDDRQDNKKCNTDYDLHLNEEKEEKVTFLGNAQQDLLVNNKPLPTSVFIAAQFAPSVGATLWNDDDIGDWANSWGEQGIVASSSSTQRQQCRRREEEKDRNVVFASFCHLHGGLCCGEEEETENDKKEHNATPAAAMHRALIMPPHLLCSLPRNLRCRCAQERCQSTHQ